MNTTTVTLSDWNAGTYVFTNTTGGPTNVTYVTPENITLTNS
jgi:hypothetical protein